MGNIVGIDYSNIPTPEGEGEPAQHPYVAIRGVDIFDDENGLYKKSDGKDPVDNGLKRFLVNVSPHSSCLSSNTILNIDSNQLYAPSNGTKNSYTYGSSCEGSYGGTEYCPSAGKVGGVYSNPAPIVGAPVQFRRVFFRGRNADPIKGNISGSERAYSAVFACSNPVDVTTISNGDCYDDPSGTIYNPRDENVQYASFAYEKEWDEIEIFGGGGSSSGCESFSIISGQTYDPYEGLGLTSYEASGCDSLIFSGCSGILTKLTDNQITVCYTGCQESFTGFSGDSGVYQANGCDLFNFNGGTNIKTSIESDSLTISAPNFAASGGITVSKNTETNTITYGIDKDDFLTFLGYTETGFRVLIPTGDEMPTSFSDLAICPLEMLYKCPDEDTTYITGCCDPLVGACCENGSVSSKTESACGGYFWGVGTSASDQPSNGSAPYYNYTISELCDEGVGCVYNNEYDEGGTQIIGYECYDGGAGTVTRREYLDHIDSDPKYNSESATTNPSSFKVGAQCSESPCDTATSTTSTSTSTSTSTTSSTTDYMEGGGGGGDGGDGGGGDGGGGVVYGCTDPYATNYDPTATMDDDSCVYY